MRSVVRLTIELVVLVSLVAGGAWAYQNRYELMDWYFLRDYTPPVAVASLANQASMTDLGRRLFYRAHPQIDLTHADLARDCRIHGEKTLELGCYLSSDQIYIFNISDPDLQNEMVVAAAHETLHAAYDRLSYKERAKVDSELERVAATITDSDFRARMDDYARLEPGERDNELHSILGTERAQLTPALEAHYIKYFSNRAQIVTLSNLFETTFNGLHTQIQQLDAKINAEKATMQSYLSAGNIRAYNSLVPGINTDINNYNQKVEQYNQYSRNLLGQQQIAPAQ